MFQFPITSSRFRRPVLCAFLLLAPLHSVGEGATYYFTKVADEATAIPGHAGFVNTFLDFETPALDGEKVVFRGLGAGFDGVVQGRNGAINVLVSNSTTMPNSPNNETFGAVLQPDVDGDYYVFYGAPPQATESELGYGVYLLERHTSPFLVSTLSVIADSQTTIPFSAPLKFNFFTLDTAPTVDGGTATYYGANYNAVQHLFNQAGVYQHHFAGAVGRIADNSTLQPNTIGQTFDGFWDVSSYGSAVAFAGFHLSGSDISQAGVYTARPGVLPEKVADFSTPIPSPAPGGTGNFSVFGYPAISNTKVAFVGGINLPQGQQPQGIYASDLNGSNLTMVVNSTTIDPATGKAFELFSNVALDTTNSLAFSASTVDNHTGIYKYSFIDHSLRTIISNTEQLDGKPIGSVNFRQQGFDGGDVAFLVGFDDDSEAVYVARQTLHLLSGPAYVPLVVAPGRRVRTDLSFAETGAGISEPLFFAPTEPIVSEYRDFVIEGTTISRVDLPESAVVSDRPVLLYLYDDLEGRFLDDPLLLDAGQSLDLLQIRSSGFQRLRFVGLPISTDLSGDIQDPLAFGAVGLTFLEASNSMASVIITTSVPEPSAICLAVLAIVVVMRFHAAHQPQFP